MNYLTYGNKQNKAIVFIHGMASTALLCYEPILEYFENYYVVLVEVDGHSSNTKGNLTSLKNCCDDIEKYIIENLNGHIYGLCGFSMGATMAVELIGRGNISVDKTVLDAAFTVKMGLKTKPFELCFSKAIKRIQQGKMIPKFLLDSVMGKDNNSVIEMLYQDVTSDTIINACEFVYKYEIPTGLNDYKNPVLFLRGSREPYPRKSAAILKNYLPQMKKKVFKDMGHGQYLHEHPAEYAKILLRFFGGGNFKNKHREKQSFKIRNLGNRIVNNWIYPISQGYVLIDTGYENGYSRLKKKLALNHINLEDICYVFLTHAHDDHAGFLNDILNDCPNIRVIASYKSLKTLYKGQNSFEGGCTGILALMFCKIMKILGKGAHKFPPLNPCFEDRFFFLSDDNREDLGRELGGIVFDTPGHTSDSISLYLNNGVLFCGDAAMNGLPALNKVTIWAENIKDFHSSWKTIIDLKPTMIYPGHGKPFRYTELVQSISKNRTIKQYPLSSTK